MAASIPVLRPGWRVVSSSGNTYLSHRASGPKTDEASFVKQPHSNNRKTSHDAALEAAIYAALVEAHEAQSYGTSEAGFAMRNLPDDVGLTTQGIRKTTTIDVEDGRPAAVKGVFPLTMMGAEPK